MFLKQTDRSDAAGQVPNVGYIFCLLSKFLLKLCISNFLKPLSALEQMNISFNDFDMQTLSESMNE